MTALTPGGLPIPEETDPLADVAQWITDLAGRLDPVAFAAAMLSSQSIPNAVWTDLTNWTETEDNRAALAAGVFTAPVRGIYLFSASIFWATNAAGARYLALWRQPSGGAYAEIPGIGLPANATVDNRMCATSVVEMGVGDKIVPRAFQNSGGNLNVAAAASNYMTWGGALLLRTAG